MNILTLNAGSSSVKFSIYDMANGALLFKDQIERVNDVAHAMLEIPSRLAAKGDFKIDAVGHRVPHGGNGFKDAVIIDSLVMQSIELLSPLAPLHNPPALAGIMMAQKQWPTIPHVAVFDTAFHQTIPEYAHTYAIPNEWRQLGVRRFGFHGTSHKYVMQRVADELKTPASALRIISCHLGNGASLCAIENGVSIDTSMGLTPLEGLVMGSRSGDVDPGLFGFIQEKLGLTAEQIDAALYNASGLKALSGGLGNDMRDIEQAAADGNVTAQLALQVYAYRVRKYIGAYAAVMGGVDVVAFTGGIGENSASMRRRVCDGLEFLGLHFDDDKNHNVKLVEYEAPQVQLDHSRVRVIVTQTREQWMIACEAARIIQALQTAAQTLPPIPVAVSARHVHLNQQTVEQLFGVGYQLQKRNDLSQPSNWAAEETVNVIGPRGVLENVRVLGPCRADNQIEISKTDSFALGLQVPVRLSGHIDGTPKVKLVGPAGEIITHGLIIAMRHIHMTPDDAERFGVQPGDCVDVEVDSDVRDTVFRDVVIRVDKNFRLEMHIDTDEANAAAINHAGEGVLIATTRTAHATKQAPPIHI